jgi:predicted TIM-barrel fold metal-dependent hydrolase
LGFERAVIVQASAHGTDNRAMLDALASDPRRYRGVALIDDSFSDRDLERMHEAGVRGARFNFVRSLGGHPDMAVFHRTVERIKALGWHVVLHFSGPDIPELSPIIRALPVPFVIDHMGRVDAALGTGHEHFQELLRLVMLDGAWVKLSGAERMTKRPYDVAMPFARALFAARPDRVLWGTDFPHPNLKDSVDETETVALIPQFAPTLAQQQALLVDNPTRLYGFT